jgi:phenylalanyl-tRNA synthetase beta chain
MTMLISWKWLKDYVEIDLSPEELAEKLTMAGIPVATVTKLDAGIEKVVTGKLVEVGRHPGADKLSICGVDVGTEILQIVTGADNIRQGDIVPVALIGAKLPSGLEITESKLRGVASNGMLCSASELNMELKNLAPEQRTGIYILPSDTPLGLDAIKVLGLDDVVLEFELTANRADCFSVIGIAREVSALTGKQIRMPLLSLQEKGENVHKFASVQIEAPELCTRFAARVIRNVKVGPSPEWMQQRLRAAGMRPISNIVDITNYVLLEMGQPLHAYDYNLIGKQTLIARNARKGEKLTTLDGNKRELSEGMLVIADAVQPAGVAGVMGGLATEVTANTKAIILESAVFDNVSIRRTAKALGLRTEASHRYEKGVDINGVIRAIDRAAKLMEELGAGEVCKGVIDQYVNITFPTQISLDPQRVNRFLGTRIATKEMVDILERLEFTVEGREILKVTVPTWRHDVTREADLFEEIGRIFGYNNIPDTLPKGHAMQGGEGYGEEIQTIIRESLVASGLYETVTFSFSHPRILDALRMAADSSLRKAIPLLNPITEDFPILRTTLLGNTLEVIAYNINRKVDDVKVFEMGTVFLPKDLPLTELPIENQMLVGAITGKRYPTAWNQGRDIVDFYDLKGTVETLLQDLGIANYRFAPSEHPSLHPGKTAAIFAGDTEIGVLGEVHPLVQEAFGLSKQVYLFELSVDSLIAAAALIPQYQALPKYPAITRDLALLVDNAIPATRIISTIQKAGGSLLKEVTIFDVYTGEQVPTGQKSMAFALVYQAQDRTLTDKEIEEVQKSILEELSSSLKAQIRM